MNLLGRDEDGFVIESMESEATTIGKIRMLERPFVVTETQCAHLAD
jgi:hypothetical protein